MKPSPAQVQAQIYQPLLAKVENSKGFPGRRECPIQYDIIDHAAALTDSSVADSEATDSLKALKQHVFKDCQQCRETMLDLQAITELCQNQSPETIDKKAPSQEFTQAQRDFQFVKEGTERTLWTNEIVRSESLCRKNRRS